MKQFIFLNEKKIKNSTRVWSVFDGHLCSSNNESSPKWLREKQAVTKKNYDHLRVDRDATRYYIIVTKAGIWISYNRK